MSTYRSSIGRQLRSFEDRARALVERTVKEGGRRFRAAMMTEWLNKPIGTTGPGVSRITGRGQRSLRYTVQTSAYLVTMDASIGGGLAPYMAEHEERGRIQFKATFEREAQKTLEEIRSGMAALARIQGRASGGPAVAEGGAPSGGRGYQPVSAEAKAFFRQYAIQRDLARMVRQNRRAARAATRWRSMSEARGPKNPFKTRKDAYKRLKLARAARGWRSMGER